MTLQAGWRGEVGRTGRRSRSCTAALLLAALALAGCSSDSDQAVAETPPSTVATAATDDGAADPSGEVAESSEGPAGEGAPGCEDLSAAGPWAVGRSSVELTDTSRGTEAHQGTGAAPLPSRTIPLTVLYPAAGDPTTSGEYGEDAEPAQGRFPLVVYSHGVGSRGTERNDDLASWARAGYVVVAPTFPVSSGEKGVVFGLAEQPADVMFVLDSLRSDGSADSPLPAGVSELVTGDCLALVGHSLGAATTMATTFDPCCRPEGLDAAVGIAGFLYAPTVGLDWSTVPTVPLLLVHGAADATVPVEQSDTAASSLPGPVWFLRFTDGAHSSMFEPPEDAAFDATVVAFLDAELRGTTADLDALAVEFDGTDGVELDEIS